MLQVLIVLTINNIKKIANDLGLSYQSYIGVILTEVAKGNNILSMFGGDSKSAIEGLCSLGQAMIVKNIRTIKKPIGL